MARGCRVNIAGGAAQGQDIGVEARLVYQILEQEICAGVQLDGFGFNATFADVLLRSAYAIVASIIGVIGINLFLGCWCSIDVVVVQIVRRGIWLRACSR